MPTAVSSRNSGLAGIPSSGMHQPSGSLPVGRFASNNLPVALSQLSYGGARGHTGMTSREGINAVGSSSYSSGMNGIGSSVSGTSLGSGAVNNRGPRFGASASIIGSSGLRTASSVGSLVAEAAVGSGINRTANSGTGINAPSLGASRVNLGP
eukprot:c18160_g1_i1 orf=3-458(-)